MKWFSVNSHIQTLQCKSAVSLCSCTESSWVIVCSDSATVNLADIFLFIVDSLSCQVKKKTKNACYSFPEPVLTLWKSDQLSQSQRFSGYFWVRTEKSCKSWYFLLLEMRLEQLFSYQKKLTIYSDWLIVSSVINPHNYLSTARSDWFHWIDLEILCVLCVWQRSLTGSVMSTNVWRPQRS